MTTEAAAGKSLVRQWCEQVIEGPRGFQVYERLLDKISQEKRPDGKG